jgi:hypothetical protein
MREWLPRVPLALVACARVLLLHGEVSRACETPVRWPVLAWPDRLRPVAAPVARSVP